jgi:hypothetical protein
MVSAGVNALAWTSAIVRHAKSKLALVRSKNNVHIQHPDMDKKIGWCDTCVIRTHAPEGTG